VQAAESLPCLCQALAFPDQLYDVIFDEESVSSKTPIRLYGGALLSECRAAALWSEGTRSQNGRRGQSLCPAGQWQWGAEHLPLAKKLFRVF